MSGEGRETGGAEPEAAAEVEVAAVGDEAQAADTEVAAVDSEVQATDVEVAAVGDEVHEAENAAGGEVPATADELPAAGGETQATGDQVPPLGEPSSFGVAPAEGPLPSRPAHRRASFVAGWLASALAVGTGAGFGILAMIGASQESVISGAPVAPPTTQPSVTSGVRSDGTHYGSVKDFLLPVPDGYKPGPDEGDLGNDAAIRPDQADPTVALLFGSLPASDMSTAQGAISNGHMNDGAVRTYKNEAGTLDVAVTVLRLDPAQSAESTGEFERVVKQSRAFRTGPKVPGHPDALCVLPVTHVGDRLDSMTCLATVGDTFAIVNADGTVPLDANAVTELFGRQLDTLKGGLT